MSADHAIAGWLLSDSNGIDACMAFMRGRVSLLNIREHEKAVLLSWCPQPEPAGGVRYAFFGYCGRMSIVTYMGNVLKDLLLHSKTGGADLEDIELFFRIDIESNEPCADRVCYWKGGQGSKKGILMEYDDVMSEVGEAMVNW